MFKVSAFWEEASDEAITLFNRAFFPAVVRRAKEGYHTELFIDDIVLRVFRSVIIRQGFSK